MDDEQKRLAEELLFSEPKKPSFAKTLYFGHFDSNQVLPYPHPPLEELEKTEEFIKKVDTFANENIDPTAIDRQSSIPNPIKQGLANLGVLGMTVPKEYNGLGMSQYAYCKTTETLARHCGSTTLYMNVHQSIGLKALMLFGSEEQKNRWLPDMARGEKIGAFSLTEQNAGSDANGVETTAVYDAERNAYILNGRKQWTTNGSIAKVITVMAKTEVDTPQGKQKKVTAFLVNPEMHGFRVTEQALDKVGFRGTWTANLAFHDMIVPVENILGPLGGGLKVALTVLDYGRTTFGAMCTGVAKECLERATQHAKTRHQFGKSLASFGLVKKKIATMAAMTYAMDATTYLTAGLIDKKVEDIMLESAILKVFNSEALWQIIYDTMQIYGGRSFFTDQPFERYMRDARLNMIGEGANEVMRAFIGLVGMRDVGVQLKNVADALKSPMKEWEQIWRFSVQTLGRLRVPNVPIQSPLLKREANSLGKATQKFGNTIVRLLGRYREDIMDEQLILNRVANMAMALYTASAVISKLDSDLERVENNPDKLGNDVEIAKLYLKMAIHRVHCNLHGLKKNFDSDILQLSDDITGVID